ncbi:hypothetical protein LVD15_10415 [Fulvivirga maritima]|uniref:hypothetical protein n=1 Tax=Fulvivirga maritima TaxID=2904247 RepID=UPI001F422B52|nr:hypothetical protein [Fulvivirga maritima]UII28812.1 hypothetical protein LVD15_10415 [Fulvivirga maritima]
MKKHLSLILALVLLCTSHHLYAQPKDGDIKSIREDLFYSDFDLDKCWEFHDTIEDMDSKSPVIKAYLAASEALIAKYSWNPVSKYSYLRESESLLSEAVSEDDDNLEIRFLRLYIQRSIPSYMGMSKNIKEDKKVIMANLDQLNVKELGQDIVDYIVTYMSSPEVSTADEATLIKDKLSSQ